MRIAPSMKLIATLLMVGGVCVTLGGCRFSLGKPKAPSGQVLATVEGEEITSRQLQAEMGSATFPSAAIQKQAQQQALQAIIQRKILAKAARDQKIDKSPTFAIERDRAIENLQVQLLAKKSAESVPAPTKDEADQFVAAHPDLFAHRKIILVDQVVTGMPTPEVAEGMKPIKTLEDLEQYLTAHSMTYGRSVANVDALGADPKVIEQIMALGPNEIFIIPGRGNITINHVRSVREEPFIGDKAQAFAIALLRRQREQQTVQKALSGIMAKAAPSVVYNPAFKPVKPAAAPAPSAAAQPNAQ